MFDWLGYPLRAPQVLDAFSGSGALAFESYSRSAGHVTACETKNLRFLSIQETARQFDIPETSMTVFKQCGWRVLSTQAPPTGWDLIFWDPPFADCVRHCRNLATLDPDQTPTINHRTRIVVELPLNGVPPDLPNFSVTRHLRTRHTKTLLYAQPHE